ncbi:hypothetical protein ABK046_50105, partial [Streptomyces caeruleatus]
DRVLGERRGRSAAAKNTQKNLYENLRKIPFAHAAVRSAALGQWLRFRLLAGDRGLPRLDSLERKLKDLEQQFG